MRPIIIDEIESTLAMSIQEEIGSKEKTLESLLRQLLNIHRKRIPPKQRKVKISNEIAKNSVYIFEKNNVIKKLIFEAESGEELSKYLSHKTEQLDWHDKCLSHFDIHHFHLGEKIENKGSRAGRLKGTKKLLFARVTSDTMYLIDILSHDSLKDFLNLNLIRIIYRNWPETLDFYRIRGAISLPEDLSDPNISRMLANNVNCPIELAPGFIVFLPGMGTSTAGTSAEVERDLIVNLNYIETISKKIINQSSEIKNYISRMTGLRSNLIKLHGRITKEKIEIFDQKSNVVLASFGLAT